jgi:hypothetical protein
VARKNTLPERSFEDVVGAFPHYRQSLLSSFDNCALSALFGLEGRDYTNAAQARGIIFHRTAAEILRTLKRTGETKMPVEEALQILYEQSAQRDVPDDEVVIVPSRERRLLRIGVIKLVSANTFRMKRLIAVERRLAASVKYDHPDGGTIERVILPDERAAQGGLATPAEAKRAGAQYVVAKQVGSQLHEACKTWVNTYGPLDVKSAKGRYQLRWKANKTGGGRTFGMFIPDDSDRGPKDPNLEAAFADVAARAKAA